MLNERAKNPYSSYRNSWLELIERIISEKLQEQNYSRPAVADFLNTIFDNNVSLISLAIDKNDLEALTEFLKYPINVNIQDTDNLGKTPLIHAILNFKNNFNLAKLLLDKKADPNQQDSLQNIPLIYAVKAGDLDMVKLLIQYKANPNIKNSAGETAFDFAKTSKKMQEILTGAAASQQTGSQPPVNIADEIIDILKKRASIYNNDEKVKLLALIVKYLKIKEQMENNSLDAVADFLNNIFVTIYSLLSFTVRNEDIPALKLFLQYPVNINIQDQGFALMTPLIHAVQRSNIDMVKLLLQYKADPNFKSGLGQTAFDFAKTQEMKNLLSGGSVKIDIPKRLIEIIENRKSSATAEEREKLYKEFEALIDLKKKEGNIAPFLNSVFAPDGTSLLSTAIDNYDGIILGLLLSYPIDVNIKDTITPQSTPLLHAITHKRMSMVEQLLKKGANPNLEDAAYVRPLEFALNIGKFNIALLLLEKGAKITAQDQPKINVLLDKELFDSLSFLTQADPVQIPGTVDQINKILKYITSIKYKNNKNITALMLAVQSGKLDLVNQILKKTDDPNILSFITTDGKTALHYAVDLKADKNSFDIIRALLEAGANPNVASDLFNGTSAWRNAIAKIIQSSQIPSAYDAALLMIQLAKKIDPNQTFTSGPQNQQNTALHILADLGNATSKETLNLVQLIIQKLKQQNGTIDFIRLPDGKTPLMLAISKKDNPNKFQLEIIKELLTNGASLDTEDITNKSARNMITNQEIKNFVAQFDKKISPIAQSLNELAQKLGGLAGAIKKKK